MLFQVFGIKDGEIIPFIHNATPMELEEAREYALEWNKRYSDCDDVRFFVLPALTEIPDLLLPSY